MSDDAASLTAFAELDRRLVAAVKGIKLLGAVSWPASVQTQFLEGWSRGNAGPAIVRLWGHLRAGAGKDARRSGCVMWEIAQV